MLQLWICLFSENSADTVYYTLPTDGFTTHAEGFTTHAEGFTTFVERLTTYTKRIITLPEDHMHCTTDQTALH
jgi:hypothetical protein